jgi:hypothetical protein
MRRVLVSCRRLLACATGTALVGYTSLMLLFAIAAIAVLGQVNAVGTDQPRNARALSSE